MTRGVTVEGDATPPSYSEACARIAQVAISEGESVDMGDPMFVIE